MLQKFIAVLILVFAQGQMIHAQETPQVPQYNPLEDPKFFPQEEAPNPPTVQEEGTSFFTAFVNMLLVLAALIAFLYIAAYMMKKYRNQQWEGANQSSDIQVLERRTIAPKAALYIVQVKDKKFLMAETPHGISSLTPYE